MGGVAMVDVTLMLCCCVLGHRPDWDTEESPLSQQEQARARRRNRQNKGILYQKGPKAAPKPAFPGLPGGMAEVRDWVEGEGNLPRPKGGQLFPFPGTMSGVTYYAAKGTGARREGWGGFNTRRDYLPLYVPKYSRSPRGSLKSRTKEERASMREKLKAERRAKREEKNPAPVYRSAGVAPECYDTDAPTRGVGALGPIGRLEPYGWWASRAEPVFQMPHFLHQDRRDGPGEPMVEARPQEPV